MADELLSRFAALLAQEKHQADRELNKVLGELRADLASRGAYSGSPAAFLTMDRYEADLEGRLVTVLATATRVLSSATPREFRENKTELDRIAIDWLRTHIDACQTRLLDCAAKLNLNTHGQLDLGRDRLLNALSAELALVTPSSAATIASAESFIDPVRLDELANFSPTTFDVTRLIRLCEELNICFRYRCFHAVAFITRAILDHIPPLFGYTTFVEVANNHPGGKSFKDVASHLEKASRKVSDGLLHVRIRRSETLPTLAQVDVRQQLDTVLAEAVRINRTA